MVCETIALQSLLKLPCSPNNGNSPTGNKIEILNVGKLRRFRNRSVFASTGPNVQTTGKWPLSNSFVWNSWNLSRNRCNSPFNSPRQRCWCRVSAGCFGRWLRMPTTKRSCERKKKTKKIAQYSVESTNNCRLVWIDSLGVTVVIAQYGSRKEATVCHLLRYRPMRPW